MTKKNRKVSKKENLYCGYQGQQRLKEVSSSYLGKVHVKCRKYKIITWWSLVF